MSGCDFCLEAYTTEALRHGKEFQAALSDLEERAADHRGEVLPELANLLAAHVECMRWLHGFRAGLRMAVGDSTHGKESA